MYLGNGHWANNTGASTAESPVHINATTGRPYGGGPWVGADLLLESFLFAIDYREIDMRASPYDCSDYGFTAIPVETSAGRLEYEQAQRALAQRAQAIRSQLIDRLAVLCQ